MSYFTVQVGTKWVPGGGGGGFSWHHFIHSLPARRDVLKHSDIGVW
jgi:hypothetical protein